MTQMTAEKPVPSFVLALGGAALVVAGLWTSLAAETWTDAALFGAAGLALWRFETTGALGSPAQVVLDALAFGL